MKLHYTTDYQFETQRGAYYNVELEATFETYPPSPSNFTGPCNPGGIESIAVDVLYVREFDRTNVQMGKYHEIMNGIIEQGLWDNVINDTYDALLEKVYADIEEGRYAQ